MRHRIGPAGTGLGNPHREIIVHDAHRAGKNTERIVRQASKEAYELFFKKFGYCDAGLDGNVVKIGIEPAYQGETLKVIVIQEDINRCAFITGIARGYYGTGICSSEKVYSDYLRRSKFVRFIDKWHSQIFNTLLKK